jgi:hypothetical protein
MKNQPPARGGGVDRLGQRFESNAALLACAGSLGCRRRERYNAIEPAIAGVTAKPVTELNDNRCAQLPLFQKQRRRFVKGKRF